MGGSEKYRDDPQKTKIAEKVHKPSLWTPADARVKKGTHVHIGSKNDKIHGI